MIVKIVKLKHVPFAPTKEQFNALIDVVNALSERVFLTEQQLSEITKKDMDVNRIARQVARVAANVSWR